MRGGRGAGTGGAERGAGRLRSREWKNRYNVKLHVIVTNVTYKHTRVQAHTSDRHTHQQMLTYSHI